MTEVVLDASVVLKWFRERDEGEVLVAAARELEERLVRGRLAVSVPSLLYLEVVNVAARRWGLPEPALLELATALGDYRFDVGSDEPTAVARWTARGLTAYDASYVALAEARRVPLVTADERILAAAPGVAQALGR